MTVYLPAVLFTPHLNLILLTDNNNSVDLDFKMNLEYPDLLAPVLDSPNNSGSALHSCSSSNSTNITLSK